MKDARQYQRDFEDMMRETGDRARYANHLRGVDNLQSLFDEAERAGINESGAWAIIEAGTVPKRGVLQLTGVVITRLHGRPPTNAR